MRPTQVIADHRERNSGVGEYLSALSGVRLRWENLSTGDYIVEERAIFERKTANGFRSIPNRPTSIFAGQAVGRPAFASRIYYRRLQRRLEGARHPARSSPGCTNNARTDLRPRRFPFAESERNIPTPDLCWPPIR